MCPTFAPITLASCGHFNSLPAQASGKICYGRALEGISAAQVAALNAQKADGRG